MPGGRGQLPPRARPARSTTVPPAPVHPLAPTLVRTVLVAGAVAVVGLWWVDAIAGELVTTGGAVTGIGRLTGLLGAYLVLVQILLMARLPWFEAAVGLDRLTRWHRALGTNVVLLLVAHVLLVVQGYAITAHHPTARQAWLVLTVYPNMLKAAAGLLLFLAVAATSGFAARRHLSHEAWYVIHLGAYLAVALTFFHQISAGADFVGTDPRHVAARWLWTSGYAGIAGSVIWFRVGHPVRSWLRYRMVVHEVVRDAPGVVSVVIRGRYLDRFEGRAGQFLLWRFLCRGHLLTAHPYSLSRRPDGRELRITVRDAGDHSAAMSRLRIGTPVLAEGPYGHFTISAATSRRVLLIGGGSGIGPIRALAEELTTTAMVDGRVRRGDDVVVLYRAGSARDVVLADEFDGAAGAGTLRIHYLVGHRRDLRNDPLSASRLAAVVPGIGEREVFVCGPAPMTAAVLRQLTVLRVLRSRVHTESFS